MVQTGTACYGRHTNAANRIRLLSRILVIDDDDAVCAAVAALLAKLGHQAVLASNTIDGIATAESGAIDVALIDMNMPMTGMRGSTTTSAEDYAILAVNFGAALFLPKPFSGNDLQHAITAVSGSR